MLLELYNNLVNLNYPIAMFLYHYVLKIISRLMKLFHMELYHLDLKYLIILVLLINDFSLSGFSRDATNVGA